MSAGSTYSSLTAKKALSFSTARFGSAWPALSRSQYSMQDGQEPSSLRCIGSHAADHFQSTPIFAHTLGPMHRSQTQTLVLAARLRRCDLEFTQVADRPQRRIALESPGRRCSHHPRQEGTVQSRDHPQVPWLWRRAAPLSRSPSNAAPAECRSTHRPLFFPLVPSRERALRLL